MHSENPALNPRVGRSAGLFLLRAAVMFLGLQSSACAPAQDTAKVIALLQKANGMLEQGDYAQAAQEAQAAAELSGDAPGLLQRAAEVLYLSGHARQSLPLFDRVVKLLPEEAAQNWQRGIALCTCGMFAEGAKQFETHHQVNPDDVENSAWYFLCIAKTDGIEAARKTVIPSRGDGRQPMMSILQMLQQKMPPEEVLSAAEKNTFEGAERRRAQFYAALYVGLYYDALGDAAQAAKFLRQSLTYGDSGYMVDTARVYLQERFPATPAPSEPAEK